MGILITKTMLDCFLLAPYYLALKFRHFLYDSGLRKSTAAEVPTVCIGNITVGGTGKTPHTEMVLRLMNEDKELAGLKTAVLSRGYRRKSKGFQQVVCGTDVALSGDEPLQIKNKFPETTVAVCSDRVAGCDFLCHPEKLAASKKGRKCLYPEFPAADAIILDDAFQHRALKPTLSILLIDCNRPVNKDSLLPIGRLRDLKERALAADVIIVSKCLPSLDEIERRMWYKHLDITDFDDSTKQGTNRKGKRQTVLFTTIGYCSPEAVFPEGDSHYLYAKRAVTFTGIANDSPFKSHVRNTYRIESHTAFGDHHDFSKADIAAIEKAANANPTAIILTTEKDSQRIAGMKNIPGTIRKRLFRVPIKASFLTEEETTVFLSLLKGLLLPESHSAPEPMSRESH